MCGYKPGLAMPKMLRKKSGGNLSVCATLGRLDEVRKLQRINEMLTKHQSTISLVSRLGRVFWLPPCVWGRCEFWAAFLTEMRDACGIVQHTGRVKILPLKRPQLAAILMPLAHLFIILGDFVSLLSVQCCSQCIRRARRAARALIR